MAGTTLLPDTLVRDVVERARAAEQAAGVVAVLLRGSHVRGTADAHSDLDAIVITRTEPAEGYRTWFAVRTGLPALHVSVGARSLERWLARGRQPAEWALGLPALEEAHYLWRADDAAAVLGDPPNRSRPGAEPELEDFVEAVVKAARGARTGDEASLRVNARIAAELAPRLFLGAGAPEPARDRRDALRLALALPDVPAHYRDDMTCCLGLESAAAGDVGRAVERLGRGVLAHLRAHHPELDPQPGVAEALASGAFERHVAAAFGG